MSTYDETLAMYNNKGVCFNNEEFSVIDEKVDTVYTDKAYLISSIEENHENIM